MNTTCLESVERALRDGMTVFQAEYYLNQWQGGVFKKGEEVLPAPDGSPSPGPAVIKQECQKCLKMAYAPNLQTVFIHRECPPDSK